MAIDAAPPSLVDSLSTKSFASFMELLENTPDLAQCLANYTNSLVSCVVTEGGGVLSAWN